MAGCKVLQSITAALGPLASLTDLLSGEKHVTISAVLPLLHLIKNDLLKQKDSDSTLTSDIKQRVILDISKHYIVSQLSEKSITVLKYGIIFGPML